MLFRSPAKKYGVRTGEPVGMALKKCPELVVVQMVCAIRNIEKALGTGIKQPAESEKKNINIVRKSIVASTKIKKNEVLTEKNITTKRPGNGISPMRWNSVIGTKAIKNFEEDDLIEI